MNLVVKFFKKKREQIIKILFIFYSFEIHRII